MGSKLDQQIMDSNALTNNVLEDIINVEKMESMLKSELSSEDLLRIDCAILTSLRETKDFSKNLLKQLETECFETMEKHSTINSEITKIQQQAIMEITQPLQNMFDEMVDFVADAFV